jgi:hypothetical protein
MDGFRFWKSGYWRNHLQGNQKCCHEFIFLLMTLITSFSFSFFFLQ